MGFTSVYECLGISERAVTRVQKSTLGDLLNDFARKRTIEMIEILRLSSTKAEGALAGPTTSSNVL